MRRESSPASKKKNLAQSGAEEAFVEGKDKHVKEVRGDAKGSGETPNKREEERRTLRATREKRRAEGSKLDRMISIASNLRSMLDGMGGSGIREKRGEGQGPRAM